MKRINIGYNGQVYSIGETDLDQLKAQIASAVGGDPLWLSVNYGEGRLQTAQILVGRGIPISLMPVPADD